MKKSVLILGAASAQMPLVEFVKNKGYRVIVASMQGNYPCFKIADRAIFSDVCDENSILSQIENEKVVAVLTDQTDLPVTTVAKIAKKLGLSANDEDIARHYSNKFLMRSICDKLDLPNVFYKRFKSEEELDNWNLFPAIIKPEDNQGSRGIKLINNKDELKLYFNDSISFSKSKHVIVEEFFAGEEVVVEGFVQNGEYINLGIGDRKYFNLESIFIPSQTIFPSTLDDNIKDKLLNFEVTLHKYLKPSFGMIHSEYLVNKENGEIRLVETALRGGGVYISSHLIPLSSGVDNYSILFAAALGNSINLNEIKKNIANKAAGYLCFHLPKGKINKIEGLNELKHYKGIVKFDFSLHEGDIVEEMQTKPQRLGPFVLCANDLKELELLIAQIKNTLKIEVETAEGIIKGIIWE